jgi:type II secretory pathway component GspD/PulD (secretin)
MRPTALPLLLLLTAFTATAAEAPKVRFKGGPATLTVQAEQADLRQTLARISGETGIAIWIDPQVQGTVTADIHDQPLEEAFRTLLRPYGNVLIYGASDRLKAVRILAPGGSATSGGQQLLAAASQPATAHASDEPPQDRKLARQMERLEKLQSKDPAAYERRLQKLKKKYPAEEVEAVLQQRHSSH